MYFQSAVFALLVASATAVFVPQGEIAADGKAGARLLKGAKVIEPSRHLNNNNGERDVTFISQYSIKYLGCSTLLQIAAEGQGGEETPLYNQNLVKFALCPTDGKSCSGGGVYVTSMNEFVDAWTEAKLTEREYACEMVRENCYCQNANNEEYCQNQCYQAKGMGYCIQYEGQNDEFQIQEYLECKAMENGNNNGNQYNYNGNQYNQGGVYYGDLFVGPYCAADGKSIHLGVFYDETCTAKASESLYASRNYGASLPFSKESIIDGSEMFSCKQQDNNNNQNQYNGQQNYNNQYQNYYAEPNELCTQAYERSIRCEDKMNINYQDNNGCTFIKNVLPKLESANRSGLGISGNSSGGAARFFAWVFALTTIAFGAYAYFLYRKIKRTAQDGLMS